VLLFTPILASCLEFRDTVGPDAPLERILVSPTGASVSGIGSVIRFTAEGLDELGPVVAPGSVTWSSLNPEVAVVDPVSGEAVSVGSGQVTIEARAGALSGFALLTAAIPGLGPVSEWVPGDSLAKWSEGVWGSSSQNVFAVGGYGAVLHFDGARWTSMQSGTDRHLEGVWGTSGENVFAVGQDGIILRFDGAGWTEVPSGTSQNLRGVWGASPERVFAVGDSGTILHFDGTSWEGMVSGTTEHLLAIWGTSPSDIHAVGYQGTILHFDGAAWIPSESGTDRNLRGIWGASPNDVFAVGSRRTLLRYDGSNWNPMSSSTPEIRILKDVWGTSPTDVYVVGHNNTLLHFDGGSWRPLIPSEGEMGEPGFFGVWGTHDGGIHVVGGGGVRLTGRR
jgi:hypothetical protein